MWNHIESKPGARLEEDKLCKLRCRDELTVGVIQSNCSDEIVQVEENVNETVHVRCVENNAMHPQKSQLHVFIFHTPDIRRTLSICHVNL